MADYYSPQLSVPRPGGIWNARRRQGGISNYSAPQTPRTPQLFGPRPGPRPTFLSTARRLAEQERLHRTNTGPTFWGRTWRSSADMERAVRNYPVGFSQRHGGRGLAEVRRDEYLNALQAMRGRGPTAPTDRRSAFTRWGEGARETGNRRWASYDFATPP